MSAKHAPKHRTEVEYTKAHPKDRALALAIVRLGRIESLPANGEHEIENAKGHATLALDEIANLSPVLAMNVEEVRDCYRRGVRGLPRITHPSFQATPAH